VPPPDAQPPAPNIVSLDPQNWYFFYGFDMPPHPYPQSQAAWAFSFPSWTNQGHVNYVESPFTITKTPSTMTMTFRIDSVTPQYSVLDPTDIGPATIHLFFEQAGDNLTNQYGRWWAQDPVVYNLGSNDNQTIVLSVALTWDHWSSVLGLQDPTEFSEALQNIGWVGFTCGGQFFWGHGVTLAGGEANFELIDFQVN
jgi:hypothetical protein